MGRGSRRRWRRGEVGDVTRAAWPGMEAPTGSQVKTMWDTLSQPTSRANPQQWNGAAPDSSLTRSRCVHVSLTRTTAPQRSQPNRVRMGPAQARDVGHAACPTLATDLVMPAYGAKYVARKRPPAEYRSRVGRHRKRDAETSASTVAPAQKCGAPSSVAWQDRRCRCGPGKGFSRLRIELLGRE